MEETETESELHDLCRKGEVEDVKTFLKTNGNQHINIHDKYGYTPIHYTVRRPFVDVQDMLNTLVSSGANVNSRTVLEGDTSLHIVVQRFQEEEAIPLTLLLLSHGADPDYRNDKYRTAYDIALSKSMVSVADYLTSDMTSSDALAEIERYKQKCEDEKAKSMKERLVKAVISGNQDDIDLCISHRADPNHMNQYGAAAIHYTITHCPLDKLSLLQKLVDTGADVNLQDYEGDTALNLVIKTTQLRENNVMMDLVNKLLQWGSDPSLKDLDEKDANMLATERGYTDVVERLSNPPMTTSETDKMPSTGDLSNVGNSSENVRSNTPGEGTHGGNSANNLDEENDRTSVQGNSNPGTPSKASFIIPGIQINERASVMSHYSNLDNQSSGRASRQSQKDFHTKNDKLANEDQDKAVANLSNI